MYHPPLFFVMIFYLSKRKYARRISGWLYESCICLEMRTMEHFGDKFGFCKKISILPVKYTLTHMKYILHFLVTAWLVWLVATYGTSIGVVLSWENTFVTALLFSVILAVVNVVLGTILRVLTFPLALLTLGAFYFIVTLVVVWVADSMYDGITLNGIFAYIVVALIPTVTGTIVSMIRWK